MVYPLPHSVRRCIVVSLTAGLILVGTVFTAKPASASNNGSTSCGGTPRTCVNISWYLTGLYRMYIHPNIGPNMVTELEWNMVFAFNATDVEMTRTYSSTAYETRVELTFDPLACCYAWVDCPVGTSTTGSHPNRRCAYIRLWVNGAYVDTSNGDPSFLAALACHELAHTVGLRHSGVGSASCVRDDVTAGVYQLTAHDKAHVQARYT